MTGPAAPGVVLPPPPSPEWSPFPEIDPAAVARLTGALSLPAALCAVLVARDITEPGAAKRFLRPGLEDLQPPGAMKDLDRAADRILTAVRRNETIFVHGDYDVDGVCAAALLTLWLRHLGASVVPFVPHRVRDGYDLGPAGLRAAKEAGASLLVTCDSGILAHDAVGEACALGIDVIVTDHHTPGPTLPPAAAVLNPNRLDCAYPDPGLCGAGVAFKLCQALAERAGASERELWEHLDLVALATIADLVPLRGENRVLVRVGLRYLARTRKPGLRALLRTSGLAEQEEIDAGQVGFVLAPRINAAGRMGDAERALRLLLTRSEAEAGELAGVLEEDNRLRRETDHDTLDEALALLSETFDQNRDFGVVLAGEGWHPGVIGIVASRVVERIHRPVVLIALDGDRGRGSARSIPGVHVLQAVEAGSDHLGRFGGHRQAAGLDIAREEIPAFRAAFQASVSAQLQGRAPRPTVRGDLQVPLAEADEELHRLLRYVGPYGMGNPRPVFRARGVRLVGAPRIVGERHLKLRLCEGSCELDAIGFGMAERVPPRSLVSGAVDVLFHLRDNEYRGRRSLQARLVDVRPTGDER